MAAPDGPINPYAPPGADLHAPPPVAEAVADAESVRRFYLGHESAIRRLGRLHLLVASLASLLVIALAAHEWIAQLDPRSTVIVGFCFAMIPSACGFALGFGLMAFQTWARWIVAALTFLGLSIDLVLFAVSLLMMKGPIPLLISFLPALLLGHVLFLLLSTKGEVVFSAEYRAVISQTSNIQPRLDLREITWLLILPAIAALGLCLAILG